MRGRHPSPTTLVAEIDRIAREHRLAYLQLESSVTAEPFYAALRCQVEERGTRVPSPGVAMAATKVRKLRRLSHIRCVRQFIIFAVVMLIRLL